LKIPVVKVGKADELLKGEDVSVSEDADNKVDDSSVCAEVVVDGAPSLGTGIRPESDTLGNTSPRAVRPVVTPGRTSNGDGARESD
jgi:hypothetical protein